jgi:23S rRNA pseudouridine2457 synthase
MEGNIHRYFIINKPFNMVSQFVSKDHVRLLGDIVFPFPLGTHAIGRLDNNSEGLLILTTNKKLTQLLFQGSVPHTRKYLVKVKNKVSQESLEQIRSGISFKIKNGKYYTSLPCEVIITQHPENLFSNGLAEHENRISTWLYLTLTEGKYHQIRKMMRAIKHPCIRLIRVAIEHLELGNLQPAQVLEIEEDELFSKLNIERI